MFEQEKIIATYCDYVKVLKPDNIHRKYHDKWYGFPMNDDNELFGRLLLEINQAGLSWEIILKKEENFREAFDHFDIEKIAQYGHDKKQALLGNAGIIRNRLKIESVIHNANKIITLREEYGSWKAWLDFHSPKLKNEWVKLFKTHFKFTGGEITGEFLMSTGYLPGAHQLSCPIYEKTRQAGANWFKYLR